MPQAVLKANVPLLLFIPFSPSSPSMYCWYMRWFHIDCSSFLVQRTQKSISETELAELRQRSQTTTTYLQIPPRPTAPQLTRQRSQPIQPRPSGTTLSPASGNASSTTPPPPQSMNIPTLAVTPVSSAPNIVIEHYPTIIRLVSIEEMNTGTDPPPSTIPTLTRASSCTGEIEIILMVKTIRNKATFLNTYLPQTMLHSTLYDLFSFGKGGTSTDTLQVPCFATDSVPSSSSHSPSKLRVSLENSKKAVRNSLNLSNLLISRSRLRNI